MPSLIALSTPEGYYNIFYSLSPYPIKSFSVRKYRLVEPQYVEQVKSEIIASNEKKSKKREATSPPPAVDAPIASELSPSATTGNGEAQQLLAAELRQVLGKAFCGRVPVNRLNVFFDGAGRGARQKTKDRGPGACSQ